ncbi:MAG: hypothetical protein HC934_08810 [Acaryochloridaceae cyanobacterium SU_2_1]|nr:hypothetical protein [Acaryochloridaceae cyanobacterium SU_2_1]
MTTQAAPTSTSELPADSYVVIGLATCFIKQENKLQPIKIIEPIPSAALEAILKGIPTSYEMAMATTLGAVWINDAPQAPPQFTGDAEFCEDFGFRLQATARSYASRPIATEHLSLGTLKTDFNFSTERKRMLNADRVVNTEDNVKQHSHTHKVL